MKLGTHAKSGENVHLIWVSEVSVTKWLDSATFNISYASRAVSHTCMEFGRHVTHQYTKKSVCYFEFSQQVLCHFCHFQALYLNKLLLEIYIAQHQIWSVSNALCDIKLRRVFVEGHLRGGLTNFDVSP